MYGSWPYIQCHCKSANTTLKLINLLLSLARNDYNTTAVEFVFEAKAANQLHCVDIPIIDDNIYEQNEVMLVSLNTPDKAVQLDPQYAFITILDNDGMNKSSP